LPAEGAIAGQVDRLCDVSDHHWEKLTSVLSHIILIMTDSKHVQWALGDLLMRIIYIASKSISLFRELSSLQRIA
jgi:hypothetical protein